MISSSHDGDDIWIVLNNVFEFLEFDSGPTGNFIQRVVAIEPTASRQRSQSLRYDGWIFPWDEAWIFSNTPNESVNEAELDQTLHVNEDETPSVPTAEIFNPRSHIHCAKDGEDIGKSRKSSFLDKELWLLDVMDWATFATFIFGDKFATFLPKFQLCC